MLTLDLALGTHPLNTPGTFYLRGTSEDFCFLDTFHSVSAKAAEKGQTMGLGVDQRTRQNGDLTRRLMPSAAETGQTVMYAVVVNSG